MKRHSSLIVIGLAALGFVGLMMFLNTQLKGIKYDFSEGQIYTLSEGAKGIAAKIKEPTYLYLYFSAQAGLGNPTWYNHGQRVAEVLKEFQEASNGKIRLKIIDPLPYTEAEDQAEFLKLSKIPLGSDQHFYLGLVARGASGSESSIPLLDPSKEAFLEYDIAKLLHEVTVVDKPKVGLITGFPMTGQIDPTTGQRHLGWIAFERLKSAFDLTVIPGNAANLPQGLDAIAIVHPKDMPIALQKAIDQYVLSGGKLMVFVDPYPELDMFFGGNDLQSRLTATGSDLPTLFKAWGIQLKPNTLLADSTYALELQTQDNTSVRHPGFPQFVAGAFNPSEGTVNALRRINMAWVGVLEQTPDATTDMIPLIQSSTESGLLDGDAARYILNPKDLYEHFTPNPQRYTVAARITGPAKTAFPDTTPALPIQSADNINLVVVADADLLGDFFWVDIRREGERRVAQTIADNGNFLINSLDQLTGGTDLLSIRTKGSYQRPFTLVNELRRAAEERLRNKEQELQRELTSTQEKIKTLGGIDRITEDTTVNTQQQQAIFQFQERITQIRAELRLVRSQLNQDIEDLGRTTKMANMASMILIVTLIGLAIWVRRRMQRGGNA